MRVLQFAFDGERDNPYLPHNFVRNTVVYTGTHDNDTTRGWYQSVSQELRDRVRRYLARDGSDVAGTSSAWRGLRSLITPSCRCRTC